MRVAEHEDGDALHREAPNHAESVQVAKEGDVAAAGNDGEDLEDHDEIDDAVRRSEARMRVPEPVGEYAIFGDAVQDAIRADDGGIHGSGQNQRADHDDEHVEDQAQRETARPDASPGRRSSSPKNCGRILSGMIITAKNETSEVKTRL